MKQYVTCGVKEKTHFLITQKHKKLWQMYLKVQKEK